MTANLENIHEIYNIFCQKNRMNADIINLFDHFHLSQRLRHLKMEKQQGISVSLLIVLCASSECAMRVSEVSTRTSSTDCSSRVRTAFVWVTGQVERGSFTLTLSQNRV